MDTTTREMGRAQRTSQARRMSKEPVCQSQQQPARGVWQPQVARMWAYQARGGHPAQTLAAWTHPHPARGCPPELVEGSEHTRRDHQMRTPSAAGTDHRHHLVGPGSHHAGEEGGQQEASCSSSLSSDTRFSIVCVRVFQRWDPTSTDAVCM
jgi:hypothetical protein